MRHAGGNKEKYEGNVASEGGNKINIPSCQEGAAD